MLNYATAYAGLKSWAGLRSDETLIVLTADHETGGYRVGARGFEDASLAHGSHTRVPVDVYANGPGADAVTRMCRLSEVYSLISGRLR